MRFWINYIIESIGNTVLIGKGIYKGGRMLYKLIGEIVEEKKKK
ncbi:MAG: hypothetical protein ACOCRX_11345 [Candidatus Woesearchaeota archaeon]